MSHHTEQELYILSDNDLQTAKQKSFRLKLKLVFAFFTDPRITAIVLWEFS